MNLPHFISRRLTSGQRSKLSGFIIGISITATALSVATMIVSACMVQGFRFEIANKLYGFWGHIQVRSIDAPLGYDDEPINFNQVAQLGTLDGVAYIQAYAFKPAIVKTDDEIESVVLKGVGADFQWERMNDFLEQGKAFSVNDTTSPYPVIFSEETAKRLKLKVDDKVRLYFATRYASGLQMNIRQCRVAGIYKTGLADFDKMYAVCPLQMIQRLNKWEPTQVSGAEIFLNNTNDMEAVGRNINEDQVDQTLTAKTIKDMYPNLFDWLDLQKTNELIILILMTLVALVNLITMLLILILERFNFIGVMKAMGATNGLVRRVFLHQAAYIIGWGMLIGNVLGIGICALQYFTHVITLPEDSYFVNYAPVYFNWWFIIGMNIAVFVIALVVMVIPSWLVARVEPVRVLRFG